MHAMHYEITLPADYDMEIIHRRVRERGPLLDEMPGLGLKAYGVRERGVDGSARNQYSPFYLWHDPAGMHSFLWEGGFRGIVDDFGRPAVPHWIVLAFEPGPEFSAVPRAAGKRVERLPGEVVPGEPIAAAVAELAGHARREGVHSAALVVDPRSWELVRYTLWAELAPDEDPVRYRVEHVSMPGLAHLRHGRQW
ncbi:DUF4865 family protein [Amycolatopsis ultiminotia]|uniref:DUF4865 family protein n=1 Tax=Amycolatopsis ultiminotia TaxID=543629 RepID=A0ABP6XA38_9PSEU